MLYDKLFQSFTFINILGIVLLTIGFSEDQQTASNNVNKLNFTIVVQRKNIIDDQ